MSQLFFTKAAALRILLAQGIAACCVETIRIYKGSIQVTYLTKKGRCSTFLSKTAFYSDFITFRLEGAKNCQVRRWSRATYTCRYDVHSKSCENTRTVDLSGGMPSCSCPDHEKQRHYLGKAMPGCKHVLAVMGQLGHASLQDYRDAVFAKASMKRCSICGGNGMLHDSDDYPIERCYHCKGLGCEKVVSLAEKALPRLTGSPNTQTTINFALPFTAKACTTRKKTKPDPFGGFNF